MRRKVSGTKRRVSGARTHRRTHHHRRRRVSGTGGMGGMLTKAGGLILGAVAARELNTVVVKFAPSFSPLMSGIVQMGVGFILPKMVKGAFFQDIGDGMIANGGMVTIVSTGLISGIGQGTDRVAYRINGHGVAGTGKWNVVNGTGYMPVVSGLPAYAAVAGGTPNLSVVNGPQTRTSNNPIKGDVNRVFNTFV